MRAHITRRLLAMGLAAGVLLLGGCSAQQAYYGGQAWQRHECSNVIDTDERERCMRATQLSFQDYRSLEQGPRGCTSSSH